MVHLYSPTFHPTKLPTKRVNEYHLSNPQLNRLHEGAEFAVDKVNNKKNTFIISYCTKRK